MERARRSRSREEQRRYEERRRREDRRRQEDRRRREMSRRREEKRRREAQKRRKKRRRIRFLIRLVLWLLLLAVLTAAAYILLPLLCVKKELTMEVGSSLPDTADYLRWESRTAKIRSGPDEEPAVADYEVVIEIYGREVTCVLHVEDTVAPMVTTKNQTIYAGEEITAEDFIEEIIDETETTVQFESVPDCETEGTREVVLVITDEGGNVTKKTAALEVAVDTEPPVISGIEDLTVPKGGSISYKKGITVTDNIDEEVELKVDADAVDLTKVGDYEVRYLAVDAAGNETSATATVHVVPVSVDNITEELVNAEADKILESLYGSQGAETISQYDKAKKIYNWCHERIAYFDGTPKTNWVQGAYRGLVERKGDCYVYAMTAKCLLTRAGIKNMDIEKIPTPTSMHYWNLIDIGEGWHHFDTCRRVDGSTFFYKTDDELMAYSNTHDGTHNYDRSQYPDIQ